MCLLAVAVAPTRLLAVQYAVLAAAVAVAARSCEYRVEFGRVAAEPASQGVRPPCVVTGREAVRIAVRAGCASRQAGGHDAGITPAASWPPPVNARWPSWWRAGTDRRSTPGAGGSGTCLTCATAVPTWVPSALPGGT
ncbi:hypothetical protein [Streptomyces sp. NPDC057617]|uniref:hypothetical protein n=1 Tax=Streptomyces sp. NPDC057617 TaxID=3346184 RepID=UPI0036CD4309